MLTNRREASGAICYFVAFGMLTSPHQLAFIFSMPPFLVKALVAANFVLLPAMLIELYAE